MSREYNDGLAVQVFAYFLTFEHVNSGLSI